MENGNIPLQEILNDQEMNILGLKIHNITKNNLRNKTKFELQNLITLKGESKATNLVKSGN